MATLRSFIRAQQALAVHEIRLLNSSPEHISTKRVCELVQFYMNLEAQIYEGSPVFKTLDETHASLKRLEKDGPPFSEVYHEWKAVLGKRKEIQRGLRALTLRAVALDKARELAAAARSL